MHRQEGAAHTMSKPKDNAGLLHGVFDLEAMFDRCSHRLLAQDIISLRSKGHDQFRVHMVVDGDDYGIREALSHRLDRLRRGFVKLFPGLEREAAVDAETICEERPCLGSRLGKGDHLAFGGLQEGIFRVGLHAEFRWGWSPSVVNN